ncbi:MAG TPA: AAA family ATPase, partial [Candidatus Nanopelagicales bacterium]|nr:AAA family ATPase [Candidatus Nanopelagicales bacterium]
LMKDALAGGPSSPAFASIVNRTFARLVPWILDAVDQHVADFMARVAYLAPLRATAARSYRVQDLSVSEVDPDGKNLAMFMRSLSEPELESFAAFTREHLGFESKISTSGLHAEILVKEPHSTRHINLVDIGFGYTEVLPLMAILWSTCCRGPRDGGRPTSLLAIEQPELHLHPAHQVKLAGVIADAWRMSRDAQREVKIMVETHSEGIVNGLGELIRKGDIGAADVQIVIFDQDAEERRTSVRLAGYTEDGALNEDWPFGFFAPVADG